MMLAAAAAATSRDGIDESVIVRIVMNTGVKALLGDSFEATNRTKDPVEKKLLADQKNSENNHLLGDSTGEDKKWMLKSPLEVFE